MDTPSINHLLQKHGILKAFHISKVIDREEMSSLYNKLNLENESDPDVINEKIQHALAKLSTVNQYQDSIPGVLGSNEFLSDSLDVHGVGEMLAVSDVIADMLASEGFTPKECMFIIAATIKRLNLSPPPKREDEEPLF